MLLLVLKFLYRENVIIIGHFMSNIKPGLEEWVYQQFILLPKKKKITEMILVSQQVTLFPPLEY